MIPPNIKDILISHYDVEDLVLLLEIDSEELLERFDDKLDKHAHKFEGLI